MLTVNPPTDADRWALRLGQWSRHLRAAHLDGAVAALLDAAEPLGPLGAQVLWIAQPALGLVAPRGEIGALARLLEQPGGLAWVREQLTGRDDEMGRDER